MPRKKPSPQKIEQKQFHVFAPEDIKQSVEIPEKPKPKLKDLETIEKIGKKQAVKKTKKQAVKSDKYILIITEKPQAAGKIAAALSNGTDKKINKPGGVYYYKLERNNKKIIIACAVGHLFSVAQTKKGNTYPVFDIEWKPNFEVRKKDFTKKYYSTIKKLVGNASEIIVATDFDIEGEVIGYNIVRFIAEKKDAKRMKFSSLTAKELQDSYDNALPTIEWGQAIAGETRHFLDWLYGINLSRALMHAISSTGKFRIMSIGRVQGPTLHLIVNREKEIKKFKSTPYWQVFITINNQTNILELKHNKDITKKQNLDKFKKLKNKKIEVTTKKTKQTINPPAPFDLTTLQTEAYKFYSITPSRTLQIAQKLYLAGLISYPRTSSQKIPEGMKPKEILKKLSKFFPKLTENTIRQKPIEGHKSDPAHPAIIPTGQYQKLQEQDKKIYNLIVKRFISCFCDNAELENKKIETEIIYESKSKHGDSELGHDVFIKEKLKFSTRGLEIINSGWMDVYPAKLQEKEIPDLNGEFNIDKIRTEEKQTKPPKRYSPASILKELEKKSLGTKATRANILETLYNRNYIKEKSIQATKLGIRLIESLEKHSPIIINEKLTREIEEDMENIRASRHNLKKKQENTIKKAETSLTKISKDFKKQEKEIGKELVKANEALWEQQKQDNKLGIKCPSCNKGELTIKYTPRFKSYFIACTNYPDCRQTFPLPSHSLIKKTDKICPYCKWPMLLRIKKGKRPWIFCPNPKCESRKDLDLNGNTKKRKPRYFGK